MPCGNLQKPKVLPHERLSTMKCWRCSISLMSTSGQYTRLSSDQSVRACSPYNSLEVFVDQFYLILYAAVPLMVALLREIKEYKKRRREKLKKD